MEAYVRSDAVVSRVIAGETLIIPIRKGVGDLASIYSLNGVASLIWSVIAQPCSPEQIVRAVESEFSSAGDQIQNDVHDFLQEMCSLGLVLPATAGAAA